MSPDLVGWIATAIVIFGTGMIAQKKKYGWLIRAAGDILWVAVGIMTGLTSIIACEGTFFVVDVIAYAKWNTDENKQRKS